MATASEEIDAIVEKADDWRGEMLARLRAMVLSAAPAIVEEVKWKKPSKPEGVAVWSRGGIICIGEMLKNAVRLTFPKGAQVRDAANIFNARLTSGKVRAVDFAQGESLRELELKALVVAAVALNV